MAPAPRSLPPTVRSARTRRTNRVVLGLLGVVFLAAGVAGLIAGFGVFGSGVRHQAVLLGTASRYARHHTWVWAAVGASGGLLALLGLAWLVVQFTSDRVRTVDVSDDPRRGRTTLDAAAVTDAVIDEIEGYHGVQRASARLVRQRGGPALLVRTALDGRVDPAEIRTRIQTEALAHARRALDDPRLPARLELRLAPRRVRDIR